MFFFLFSQWGLTFSGYPHRGQTNQCSEWIESTRHHHSRQIILIWFCRGNEGKRSQIQCAVLLPGMTIPASQIYICCCVICLHLWHLHHLQMWCYIHTSATLWVPHSSKRTTFLASELPSFFVSFFQQGVGLTSLFCVACRYLWNVDNSTTLCLRSTTTRLLQVSYGFISINYLNVVFPGRFWICTVIVWTHNGVWWIISTTVLVMSPVCLSDEVNICEYKALSLYSY